MDDLTVTEYEPVALRKYSATLFPAAWGEVLKPSGIRPVAYLPAHDVKPTVGGDARPDSVLKLTYRGRTSPKDLSVSVATPAEPTYTERFAPVYRTQASVLLEDDETATSGGLRIYAPESENGSEGNAIDFELDYVNSGGAEAEEYNSNTKTLDITLAKPIGNATNPTLGDLVEKLNELGWSYAYEGTATSEGKLQDVSAYRGDLISAGSVWDGGSVKYKIGAVVTHNSKKWLCLSDHTSESGDVPDGESGNPWKEIVAADTAIFTGGTDTRIELPSDATSVVSIHEHQPYRPVFEAVDSKGALYPLSITGEGRLATGHKYYKDGSNIILNDYHAHTEFVVEYSLGADGFRFTHDTAKEKFHITIGQGVTWDKLIPKLNDSSLFKVFFEEVNHDTSTDPGTSSDVTTPSQFPGNLDDKPSAGVYAMQSGYDTSPQVVFVNNTSDTEDALVQTVTKAPSGANADQGSTLVGADSTVKINVPAGVSLYAKAAGGNALPGSLTVFDVRSSYPWVVGHYGFLREE